MPLMINDEALAEELIEARKRSGGDRYDEVWEGVYMMSPLASNEHQRLAGELTTSIASVIDWKGLGSTLPGANVSDRRDDWAENYRIPDVLVFLTNTAAEDCGTHWLGGPEFAVEIVSPGDRSLEKLDFYAKVGTRELLVVDRRPWQLTLYRLQTGQDTRLAPAGVSSFGQPATIHSEVLPLQFTLLSDESCIRVAATDGTVIRDIPIRLEEKD